MTTKDSSKPTYAIPVSNGLFAHREKIGAAIWVFLWLIDATTKEIPGADGKAEGLVYGGQPVPLSVIAADLDMSRDAIFEHLGLLTKAGYIRKVGYGNGRPNGYAVVNSKRFANRRTKTGRWDTVTVVQKQVDRRTKTGRPSYKSPSIYKEEVLQDITRQEDTEPDDPSTAARLLCEECGNYDMRFQGDRAEQIKVEAKKRGMTCKAVAELMISRWQLFNSSRPRLNYPVQSALKFWTSGIWDNPACWALKPDAPPVGLSSEPKFNDPIAQLAALGVPARRAM
jgi:biotin operon repressor